MPEEPTKPVGEVVPYDNLPERVAQLEREIDRIKAIMRNHAIY